MKALKNLDCRGELFVNYGISYMYEVASQLQELENQECCFKLNVFV